VVINPSGVAPGSYSVFSAFSSSSGMNNGPLLPQADEPTVIINTSKKVAIRIRMAVAYTKVTIMLPRQLINKLRIGIAKLSS
jgi:hypothetical protein